MEYIRSRHRRPLEAGLRVMETDTQFALVCGYSKVLRKGELTGTAGDRVYILWDGDAEPTVHARKDLYVWDTRIYAYHQQRASQTIVTAFEED